MELWVYDVMGLWSYGVMGLWSYDVMGLWSYGVMALWGYGRSEIHSVRGEGGAKVNCCPAADHVYIPCG